MKKFSVLTVQKKYPHESWLSIKELVYNANHLVEHLRELRKFFDFYGVLSDELLNKGTELFSYKTIHILLSLKKKIEYLNKFYTKNDLVSAIATVNELDEVQFRNYWAAYFLVCQELQTTIVSAFENRLRFTGKILNLEDISNQSMEDELYQLINQLCSQISELKLKTPELIVLVNDSELTEKKTSISSFIPTNEEHLFFSMPEEIKVSILSHLEIEDLLSIHIASKELSMVAATAFAVRFKKNPAEVISHLSQITSKEAYDFVEGYRRTSEYKALNSLVENKMPMSDHEVACYMLTRHEVQLPDIEQLRTISTAPHIDKKTREHLLLLIENAQEIDIVRNSYFSPANPQKAYALLDLFKKTFPESYINLLPSIDLQQVNLSGFDLSHASLSHAHFYCINMSAIGLFQANLSYANLIDVCLDNAQLEQANLGYANLRRATLRHANLKKASLRSADLSGALLEGSLIDDADFTGTNLAYAQFINVDMRKIDLRQINVEWTYLKNLRLVPETALEQVQTLEDFFNSFEKKLVTHTLGSRTKWRIQMLKDLKRLMIPSAFPPETNILFLKKILAHYPLETFSSTIFVKKHPFKNIFEQFGLIQVEYSMNEEKLPLEDEIISILDECQERIDNAPIDDERISFEGLDSRLAQCLAKVPELTNLNQICQLSSHHFFLLQLLYHGHYLNLKPYLVNYPRNNLRHRSGSQHYASQIFDGELFHLEQLQKIQPEELDTYLFGDKDFIIRQSGSSLKRVKLGGLFINYTSKGSCSAKVEIIDFQNRQLKFGFTVDIGHYSSAKTEMYLPFKLLGDLESRYGNYLYAKDIPYIRAGFELRATITQFIFVTQKGPIPELIPITRIAPCPENTNTDVCINIRDDKDEIPLLGENRYGLYHRKAKDPCFAVVEKMLCVLT